MPTKAEYYRAVGSITANSMIIRELYHLKEVALENLIFSVDHKRSTRKIAFCLIENCKTEEYLTLTHLIDKYMPRSSPSLLVHKSHLKNQNSRVQQMTQKF